MKVYDEMMLKIALSDITGTKLDKDTAKMYNKLNKYIFGGEYNMLYRSKTSHYYHISNTGNLTIDYCLYSLLFFTDGFSSFEDSTIHIGNCIGNCIATFIKHKYGIIVNYVGCTVLNRQPYTDSIKNYII